MDRKIVSELKKIWFRVTKNPRYFEYKLELKDQKYLKRCNNGFLETIAKIEEGIKNKSELNFKHSGHIGDLVYALPVIKELAKTKKCNFFVNVNHSLGGSYYKHPSGNIMISDRSFSMLLPLLKSQDYISEAKKWENEPIDIDLDLFRKFPFSSDFHSIRWFFHIVGKQIDMTLPYLSLNKIEKYKDTIVVVRTFRGRNPIIDYRFLQKQSNILFLGIKSEYDDFVKLVPNSEFYDTKDFLELAEIINSCKFIICNQTFAFAVAEGLKVPRILEANPFIPAVFPIGGNGFDFYFQSKFEELVHELSF